MKSALRVLVVDDEPASARRLARFLAEDPGIEVVAAVGSAAAAREQLIRRSVDALFLDVQMPAEDGFDLLESLGGRARPPLVFVTAYAEHAVQAFAVEAVDYLLKPFDRARVAEAVRRLRAAITAGLVGAVQERVQAAVQEARDARGYQQRIVIRERNRMRVVTVEEVRWVEAEGNYAVLHRAHDKVLLRETMSRLERRLDPLRFVRVHRRFIVNLEWVQMLRPVIHGDLLLHLRDGATLKVARSRRRALADALGTPLPEEEGEASPRRLGGPAAPLLGGGPEVDRRA